jgi:hypothetical protein
MSGEYKYTVTAMSGTGILATCVEENISGPIGLANTKFGQHCANFNLFQCIFNTRCTSLLVGILYTFNIFLIPFLFAVCNNIFSK